MLTTEHFAYHVEEGAPHPCEGTGEWLERYYSANARFLGATLPPGERIDYYLVGSDESLQRVGCPAEASGCAVGTTIRSLEPVSAHEIVHASASLLGDPPFLFQEGLAVVLGCSASLDVFGPLDRSAPIEDLVETAGFISWREEADAGALYGTSASFVRFLVDTFGSSRFLLFYSLAQREASRGRTELVFQSVMGSSLDDAFAAWRTRPAPYASDLCLRLMECDPSMPVLADADTTLGCGPRGGHGGLHEAVFRFEVPETRIRQVATEPAPAEPQARPTISFYRCTGGNAVGAPEDTAGFALDGDLDVHIDPEQPASTFALDLPPGPHVAWLTSYSEAQVHLDVEERRTPMRNVPCQAAEEPLALEDKRPTILTTRWIERPCDGPWCPGQGWDVSVGRTGGALEAQALVVSFEAQFSPGEIYICPEPCPADASRCEVLTLDTEYGSPVRSKQTFEPDTVLHLGAPAAPFAEYFSVRLRVVAQ